MKFNSKTQDIIACSLFLIFVPILAHLSFSWMGFVPSIDGLNMAFSRRLLDGQVPYRDFIVIRPIGSALLYTPFVYFGGEYTFWISRLFVWFQFSCIAWVWTSVIVKSLKSPLPVGQKTLLAAVAFMFTAHFFPAMAWYTTDSLFFIALGLGLCFEGSSRNKLIGYAMIGLAYVCKQTFLLTVPIFLLVLGDWRRIRFWLAAASPGIIFLVYLLLAGALPDAMIQLSSRSNDFFPRGIRTYLRSYAVPWGILLGYLSMVLCSGQAKWTGLREKIGLQRSFGTFMIFGIFFCFSISLSQNVYTTWNLSFALFGAVIGATGYFIINKKDQIALAQIGILSLLTAWSGSLSTGYNVPTITSGVFFVLLFAYLNLAYQSIDKRNPLRNLPVYLLIALFIVSVPSFVGSRQKIVFKDHSSQLLTKKLDGIFPGARFIKTNPDTYQFVADFEEAVAKTKGRDFAIIPGLPAYWAKSQKRNPLPIDLANKGEMSHKQAFTNRVLKDVEAQRGKIIILLEKIEPDCLSKDFFPLPDGDISRYVRANFRKIDETRFFELYQ